MEQLDIQHEGSPWGKITISIGAIYGYLLPELSESQIIEQADQALYRAKDDGRNTVVFQEIKRIVQ